MYCCIVALTNKVPMTDCMVIGFLFSNKVFKADVIELSVLSFRRALQASRENMSITFKRYLYLSFYFERELKTARSISKKSSIFLLYKDFVGNFLAGLCKLYVF